MNLEALHEYVFRLLLHNNVAVTKLFTHERHEDVRLCVPQLVSHLDHEILCLQEEIKKVAHEIRIFALSQFNSSPFKNDINHVNEYNRLFFNHVLESDDHDRMLFEVSTEHFGTKVLSKHF